MDAFVAEQENAYDARSERLRVSAEQRRHDYDLLQIYDRMSLLFCMNDTLAPPVSEFSDYRFEPDGPGVVRMSPFPFAGTEQTFSICAGCCPSAGGPTATLSAPSSSPPSRNVRR